jgi:hypothetical protein
MKNKFTLLLTIYWLILLCTFYVNGQQNNTANREPVLAPLTEGERKIDLRSIVAFQPDFIADEIYFSAREVSGFSTGRKRDFFDTGAVKVIMEYGKPDIRIYPNKTWEDEPVVRQPFISATIPLVPTSLLGFDDITFVALGTIEIDKHKCLKIQASSKYFPHKVFLYAALDLKNLIIATQVIGESRRSIQRLQNISFDVKDDVVEVPKDYKKLPKYKWQRLVNAQVFVDGKQIKDAKVYRSELPEYLYIHVAEFDNFFVNLERRTAQIGFQGLLIAPSGQYVWRTEEMEAVSSGELKTYDLGATCEKKKCPKVNVGTNFIIFPQNSDGESIVKVTWQ